MVKTGPNRRLGIGGIGGLILMLMLMPRVWAQTVLVREGQAVSSLILPAEAPELIQTAAAELRYHIEQMSGAQLPALTDPAAAEGVKVYLGSTAPDPDLEGIRAGGDDPASFRLRVTDTEIQLVGLSDQGTLFAAYELLEQLGVRWFLPGEIGTVIPQRKTVTVRLQDTVQHPGFAGRILSDMDRESEQTWFRRRRMGGFNAGGHGLGIEGNPETEPDLFMTENGHPTNKFRVSHPEVLRRVVEAQLRELEKAPHRKYVSIGPTDGLGFGHSPWDADDFDPLHGRISATDRYVKFFNQVLEQLQKKYPEVGLGFYCYSLHMRPPVREKPNPRILPILAPIDVCRFHAIDNPRCWERQYIREVVEGWKALGVQMMYRGYLFNLADQGFPFSMIRQIAAEYPYYHQQEMIACRVECKPAWGYHGPSLYLATKIMWNPDLDVEELLEDYFSRFYGPAAEPMRAHFERLEDAYEQADFHTGNVFDIPHILTPEVRAELEGTLEQAEKRAPIGSVFARRVGMVRVAFDFSEANLKMMAAVNALDFIEAKKQLDRIQTELVPRALEHDPPILSVRYAPGFTQRFWAQTVESGYERITDGNEIVAPLPDEWLFFLDPYDGGEKLGLWKPDLGPQSWQPIRTYSQSWSNQGLRYYKGEAWYRTRVEVSEDYRGRPLRLWLGGVDEAAKAWINGQELPVLSPGSAPWGRPWEFEASEAIHFGKPNVVVVKVSNREHNELGTGGITGPAMLWAAPRH